MTPQQEKASELVNKFVNQPINFPYIDTEDGQCIGSGYMTYHSAKQCALIAVDCIITSNPHSNPLNTEVYSTMGYWIEVKQEIEKL